MTDTAQPVLDLLPAFYRERDARRDADRPPELPERREPGFLESVLTIIAEQFALVDADLDQLYDDLFIETCDPSIVPYIGDLVGVTPGAPTTADVVLTRAAVADAIALRRRKGTAAVLEQLAFDLTSWPARATEMFQRLVVTQHLQHVVSRRGTTLSFRSAAAIERVDGAFDPAAHTVDVRRIGSGRGRHNVPNVAIIVWRDQVLSRTWADAATVDAQRFRFSALGVDRALATRPPSEVALTHQASSLNVPETLTRRAMAASVAVHYGADRSVTVRHSGDSQPIDTADVVVCDLGDSGPGGSTWSNVARLQPGQIGIDPQLGRLAFADPQARPPQVRFGTTAPSDVGGSETTDRPEPPKDLPVTPVRRDGAGGSATTLAAGLGAAGANGTVEIADSGTYTGDLAVTVPAGGHLHVASADGALPYVDTPTGWNVTVGEGGILSIVGLVATGPLVVRGRPKHINIVDCTLVPGRRLRPGAEVPAPVSPSLVLALDSDWHTDVVITGSITGPLHVPADGTSLSIADSIIDGVDDGLGRSAASGAPARIVPALRSPAPLGALTLPAGSTTVRLALGADPPRIVDLGAVPTDAASAAALLDAALTGSGARALAAGGHVVLVGDGRPLAVTTAPGSPLADALALTGAAAQTRAVLGGPADPNAAAPGGALTLTSHRGDDHVVVLAAGAADLPSLAARLQTGIHAADPTLTGVVVGTLDGALVVVPGAARPVAFGPTSADVSTAWSLGLVSPRPAIAADASGTPGAALSLDRCTLFGDVGVVATGTVSDSILTGRVTSERRQIGCLQYSWIAPGSSTPRRHECQPATAQTLPPSFVSRHYGTAGYGRLWRAGATALVRGASTGFEMGAMARLCQTQRDDNLRRGIEEFLRFGLEAGVLDGD